MGVSITRKIFYSKIPSLIDGVVSILSRSTRGNTCSLVNLRVSPIYLLLFGIFGYYYLGI